VTGKLCEVGEAGNNRHGKAIGCGEQGRVLRSRVTPRSRTVEENVKRRKADVRATMSSLVSCWRVPSSQVIMYAWL